MNINLEISFIGRSSRSLRRGSFPIRVSDFKKNPDETAAVMAMNWIRKIKREHGYNIFEFELLKVAYDSEHDVTELVKKCFEELYR
jgi:hypothetical protein